MMVLLALSVLLASTSLQQGAVNAAVSLPYYESFEDNTANEFSIVTGSWGIQTEGTKVYDTAPTDSLSRATVGESSWTNYAVESKVMVNAWGDNTYRTIGLLGRYRNTDNYYLVGYESPGELRIKVKSGGTMATLASKPYTMSSNKWYSFRLEMNGTNIKLFVNGYQELSINNGAITSGKAGLISVYGDSKFDDVRVMSLSAGPGTIIESALDNIGTFTTVLQGSSSITPVTNLVRGGTHSFQHVTSGSPKRAEIDDNSWNQYDAKTNNYWYGMSYYIPNDGTYSSSLSTIVGQWRFSNLVVPPYTKANCEMSGYGGSGHHLMLDNGYWTYELQHQDPAKASCAGLISDRIPLIPFTPGVWTDVVIHAKFRHTTDGFIKIWMAENGGGYKQVLNYYGRTWFDMYQVGSNKEGDEVMAPNFTLGAYWSNSTTQRTIHTDQIRAYQIGSASDDFNTGFNRVRPEQ
ncbi:heparin lyase I family protein [Paenibacillus sp. GCM10023252]|uniref:heparin lyase I family protein n=1 Tax=Paenibacillus sp. GCM10023252 TaxID=3252649 RepID=UPI00361980D2